MDEGYMTWISNGLSQSLSTGYSWGSYYLGEGSTFDSLFGTASAGAAIGASLWSAVGGVSLIKEGWETGDKTRMAVGTVQCILAATELVPEAWQDTMSNYLGGFSSLLPAIPRAMLFYKIYEKQIGYLATGAPVAFAAGLKKLIGDDLEWGDDGIAGLFAFLTAVSNAYEADPSNWASILNKALPTFGKIIPCWALIKDREDIIDFVKTNVTSVRGYVANVSNMALKIANIPFASPCGRQVVVSAPRQGHGKKKKKGKGHRYR